ncbi:hypothetical protein [Streptomyces chiangmaiensis]|uniref:Secreted protein n=1 Tax=Streptomyces chiangmaiensis TaxID=766497 RepID=A0ABU7FTH0_9ACTN|nr:hypothetical protein [Streptomyces chiangmaiensis]MED7827387.1 hypothetical protein [Streptomyces chiangmaiensis]
MGKNTKTGDVALRLVLLTLLLLGVGVLHTLGHAGAHSGVATSEGIQHASHATPVVDGPLLASADVETAEHPDPHQHIGSVAHTEVSSCFAVVPSGPCLVPPHSQAAWNIDPGVKAVRIGPEPNPARRTDISRSQVLRI